MEKKIRTQENIRLLALAAASLLVVSGIMLRESYPWLIYLAAVPLAVMVINTLIIRKLEKKKDAEDK